MHRQATLLQVVDALRARATDVHLLARRDEQRDREQDDMDDHHRLNSANAEARLHIGGTREHGTPLSEKE